MCFNTFRGRARCARTAIGVIALLAVGASNASAQQTAVCSTMPGTGERVECTKAADSSDDIDLTLKGIDIDTTGDEAHGVYGHHEGTGKVFVAIQTGFDEGGGLIRNYIDTRDDDAHGVYGRHVGRGNIFLGGQNLHVTTAGSSSNGITGYLGYRQATPESPDPPPEAAGLIDIGVSDSTIEVTGNYSHGIFAEHYGGEGQLRIDVRDSTITALSDGDFGGSGIYGLRRGTATGDATVTVSNTNITTTGRGGIDVDHAGEDTANLTIDVDRGRITTAGRNGFAVRGYRHRGTGNVDIDVVGTVINTTGTSARGIYGYMYTNDGNIDVYAENIDFTSTAERGDGILTWFQKRSTEEAGDVLGDVLVDVRGGSITTKGVFAVGLYNRHEGTGLLDIDVRNLDIKTESTGIYRDVGTLSTGHLRPNISATAISTSMSWAGPSTRRAPFRTGSTASTEAPAVSRSTRGTAIPSPRPVTTRTASWPITTGPSPPGAWRSPSGAASRPAGPARTASGWGSSTPTEKRSASPDSKLATANRPSR